MLCCHRRRHSILKASLSNLLAAVPLGTGSFFFLHSRSRERISPAPPPMFVKFKLNITEHFRDILGRNVYGRNTAKTGQS